MTSDRYAFVSVLLYLTAGYILAKSEIRCHSRILRFLYLISGICRYFLPGYHNPVQSRDAAASPHDPVVLQLVRTISTCTQLLHDAGIPAGLYIDKHE